MMLFLASTFADSVDLFTGKVGGIHTVLFITNPADPFKSKYWMKKDWAAFNQAKKATFLVTTIDLRRIDATKLDRLLQKTSIVHVCGGSVLYMMGLLREKKMISVLVNAVKYEGVIYTGTSAGSMIVAPDISLGADDADEKEAGMVGKLKDFSGLNLVPYYIICHNQEKYYVKSTQKLAERLPKNKLPIVMLNDGMAVWHEGNQMQILTKANAHGR